MLKIMRFIDRQNESLRAIDYDWGNMTVLHNLISTNRYYYLKYNLYFKDDVMMIVTECVTKRIGIIGRRGTTENYRLLWFILKHIINYFSPLKKYLSQSIHKHNQKLTLVKVVTDIVCDNESTGFY